MLNLIVRSLIFFSNVLLVHQKKYGQHDINMKDYPFLVSVMVKTERDYLHYGGGTIVKLDVILTSCRVVGFLDTSDVTQPLDPKNIKVSAGTEKIYGSRDENQQMREVIKNALDKRCDLSKATFDIAVLTLKTSFTQTDYVRTWRIFTWKRNDMAMAFKGLTDFRLGCDQVLWSDFLSVDQQGPANSGPWISEGRVKIIPNSQCRKYFCVFSNTLCDYPFGEYGQFCAVAENGTVPCLEDIGSPLVCHGSVFGTVSFGSCSTCKPSVYISPVTMIDALKDYSPEGYNAALTIWIAKVFSLVGIMKYFLPTLVIV